MWRETLKNGKVRYAERYKDPLTLKDKKISITMPKDTAANQKKALEELTRKIEKIQCQVTTENVTLLQLYEKYMIYQGQMVKPSTIERNKRTLRKLIKVFNENAVVNKLTVAYITEKLLSMNCSNVTRNEYIRRFKAMLNWGKKLDLHQNYKLCENLTSFKEEQTKKERIQDKYLEPEEIQTLLDHMAQGKNWIWYYLTKFLLLSGLRIGEAVALNLEDISTEYISVTKTYDFINEIVTAPKTLTSNRNVYIQPELAECIKTYLRYRKEHNFEKGIQSTLFFNSSKGSYLSYYAYEKYLKEASIKVLERSITAHTLRHTHASLLLAEGVPIDTISRRLGHENSKITREIYLHTTQKLVESDNAQIKTKKIL